MSHKLVPLGSVVDYIRGITFKPTDVVEPTVENAVVCMRTKNVQKDLDESDLIAVDQAFVKRDEQYLREGDLLISSANSWELVGKTVYVPDLPYAATAGGFISIIRARVGKIDARYLFHWIMSGRTQDLIRNCGRKTTNISNLSSQLFLKLEIPLPPLEEQKRIAATLDKVDSLRRKRAQAIALADDFLRATFLDLFGDPVTNPKGWPVHRMGDLVEFKGGSQPPKDVFIDEPRDGYVRLIQIRDFKSDKYPTYIPEKLAKREFSEDDVMIARYGPPVFQILRGLSGSYNVALMKAIPKLHLTKEFVFWLLQLPAYHDVVVANSERTAGQTGVNLDLLNEMQVPLPSLEVIEALDAKTRKVSDFIEKQSLMLEELNAMSAGLAAEYFS